MARETQFQVAPRRVIGTLEDAHKYDMPDGRRLRVQADPLQIPVGSRVSGVSQLAEALGQIKPALLDYASERASDQNNLDFEAGKMDAMSGKSPEEIKGEWRQKGFDVLKSTNDWTQWSNEVQQDYDQNFDKDNGDLEQFLQDKWNQHNWGDKSQTYTERFTGLAQKTFDGLRASQAKYQQVKLDADTDAEISRTFYDDIRESIKNNGSFSVADLDARVGDLSGKFPGRGRGRLNELAYTAVDQIAKETIANPKATLDEKTQAMSMYDVFKQNHMDGTPGMYFTKARDKIDADYKETVGAYNSSVRAADEAQKNALKDLKDHADRSVTAKLLSIMTTLDGDARNTALSDLAQQTLKDVSNGVPVSESVLNTLRSAVTKDNKDVETDAQRKNYVDVLTDIGKYSEKSLHQMFDRGDLSLQGFNQLVNRMDRIRDRAAKAAEKGNKPVEKTLDYKKAKTAIRNMVGFNPYNTLNNAKESQSNYQFALEGFDDRIDELMVQGQKPQEAITVALGETQARLQKLGVLSKEYTASEQKFGSDQRVTDPVKYYQSGNGTPQQLIEDKAKLPASVFTALQQQMIQRARTQKAPKVTTTKSGQQK